VRFLLRPAWLALIVTVLAFVAACFAVLAPWQFGRQSERDAEQAHIDAASRQAPVPVATLLPVTAGGEWRQVSVTGAYLPQDEVLVRLRSYEGKPAVEVLTPLRTADGQVLVVDRGYVTTPNGTQVPEYAAAPGGTVTVTARLRLDENDPARRPPVTEAGHRQVFAADSRSVAAATGLATESGWLQLSDGHAGVLAPLPVTPSAASGGAPFTNFSYALQWITFGAIAVFALVYFVRLEMLQRGGDHPRRPDRVALRRALAGDDDEPDAPAGERELKDRYPR
jgi:cytochrome oxidase assembly protein ShyY1